MFQVLDIKKNILVGSYYEFTIKKKSNNNLNIKYFYYIIQLNSN